LQNAHIAMSSSSYTLQDVHDRFHRSNRKIKNYLKKGIVSSQQQHEAIQKTAEIIEVPILNRGISLGFLLALTETFQLHNLTTSDVVRNFITPVTTATDEHRQPSRFAELACFQQYFGPADTFVSHCWKGSWGDLVSACVDTNGSGHALTHKVWIDVFAVTQHPQLEALQDDLNALQYVIENVPFGTTLVWNPRIQIDNESNPVLRAWCLFEIHTTVIKDNALLIKMGEKSKKDLDFSFIPESDVKIVTELVYSTDIRNAKATMPEDLDRIHSMIQEESGFDELNTTVRTAVYNNWRILQIPAVQDALSGSRKKVTEFLDYFDEENYEGDPGGSLLHDLVHGNFCSAAELAIDCGAPIDKHTKKGNTPLMFAAEGGRQRMCRLLIDRGAALDLQNAKKETALHLAAKYGRVASVRLLIGAEADDSILDSGNYTPAGLAKLDKLPGCKEVLRILESDKYDCLCFDTNLLTGWVKK